MSNSNTYYNQSNEIEANLLADKLWSGAQKIRAHISFSDFKPYFLSIFFYKYISDCEKGVIIDDHNILNMSKPDVDSPSKPRFILPPDLQFDQISKASASTYLGETLNRAFYEVEHYNREKLDGIFSDIDYNNSKLFGDDGDKKEFLTMLLHIFRTNSPTGILNSIVARCFELILEKFAYQIGKGGAEFQTPLQLSELLSKLLEPLPGETIYDPACGSGSLLVKMYDELEETMDGSNLYAQEINKSISTVARMNMIVHGFDRAHIHAGDAINHPKFLEKEGKSLQRFDLVVSDPPFSLNNWWRSGPTYERFKWGMPPKSKSDYAFIQHMLSSAVENSGRVGIIVSNGVLFRMGSEGEIRKRIIIDNLLDAVIALPGNLFFNHSLPVAILLFRKDRADKRKVLFIDASNEFTKDKRQNILTRKAINRIADTYKAYKGKIDSTAPLFVEGFSNICSVAEIEQNEYNLSVNRYIQAKRQEEKIDIDQLKIDIEKLDDELAKIREAINNNLKSLGI